MIPVTRAVETDVAVVGGGIAGLCAAIAAARGGARVALLEKADTRRSGSGALGTTHFACYHPGEHGPDPASLLKELRGDVFGPWQDSRLTLRCLGESLSMVERWRSWGINMTPRGDTYAFLNSAAADGPRLFLGYDGRNQKHRLTREARRAGTLVLNHHSALDLLRDDEGVAGVLALNTSGPAPGFTLVRASRVILATGGANRLYPPSGAPGLTFRTAFCPACAGAAQAQAWRIGSRLVNMELPQRGPGPELSAGPGMFAGSGRRPRPPGRQPCLTGRGLEIDEEGRASVPGLYAAGDLVGNFRADIAGAAVFGWIAGRHAACEVARARGAGRAARTGPDPEQAWRLMARYSSFYRRRGGAPWHEVNLGLQRIMAGHAAVGPHRARSASLLTAGLNRLADLRRRAERELTADTSHSLLRLVETLDLMDNGEIVMRAALERRETRGLHIRSDFPCANPLLTDQVLTLRRERGHVLPEWRKRWTA